MEKENEEMEIDLLHIAQVLLRHAVVIILVGALFAAAAFYGTKKFITPMYDARAYLYVNSSVSVGEAKLSISSGDISAAKSLVNTYIAIMQTRMTLEDVIARSGVNYSYGQLKNMISASSVNGTEIFYVNVKSPDPDEAELIANTIAVMLPDKIASVVDGCSVRIVDYAVRPTGQSSPNAMGNARIGALLGIALAAAIVILIDLLDTQIHDTDYLTKTYDLPVLAAIPDLLAKQSSSYNYYKDSRQTGKGKR